MCDCVGLNKINRLVYCESSYQNQFPGYWFQDDNSNGGAQNVLILHDSASNDTTIKPEATQTLDKVDVRFNFYIYKTSYIASCMHDYIN